MSFYTRVKTFLAGSSAKGSDVASELDAVGAAFDTVEASMVRSIKMPVGETTDQILSSSAAARAGKVLGFDESGNVTAMTGVPASNALTVGGYSPSTSAEAGKIPVRDGNAKVQGSITGDAATVGGYGVSTGTTGLKVPVRDHAGRLPGDITGSAESCSGNAGTVTNGVYTTGNQTIGGTKTFSSPIVGSLAGNADTATQVGAIIPTVYDIGVWDMDSTLQKNVAHGLTASKILYVLVRIDPDDPSTYLPLTNAQSWAQNGEVAWDATNIILQRKDTPGVFDSTNYNSVVINRGKIIIFHNP